jgi:hypothetical protein
MTQKARRFDVDGTGRGGRVFCYEDEEELVHRGTRYLELVSNEGFDAYFASSRCGAGATLYACFDPGKVPVH